jgi:hypothetical protein
MSGALIFLQQRALAGAVRFANAHLSDDTTVAKMGHPDFWLRDLSGVGR